MPKVTALPRESAWTYGAEHEFGDWDTRCGWDGFGRDPEPNVCNSNGVAADPTLRDWPYGAEINTPPTDSPNGQGEILLEFIDRHPTAFVWHGVGLHIHVRIPGLRTSLVGLQRLQRFITDNTSCYPLIDPVPVFSKSDWASDVDYKAARKWSAMIRRSHWTAIPEDRVERQLECTTVDEFFALEAPVAKRTGRPMWHAQPRASVNLRQLLQTDTIEFRHFFGTTCPEDVVTAAEWCRDYLLCALDSYPADRLFRECYQDKVFPPVPPFVPYRQRRWEATSFSKLKRDEIAANRLKILRGDFDEYPVENPGQLDRGVRW